MNAQTLIFLDDNDRPHRASAVINAIETNGIPHVPLTPLSPVLNSIEQPCDMLQRRLDEHIPTAEKFV